MMGGEFSLIDMILTYLAGFATPFIIVLIFDL
jgi:hypothetical protein